VTSACLQSLFWEGYTYRLFAATDSSAGTKDGVVHYLVPALGPEITPLGPVAEWLAIAEAAGYCDSTRRSSAWADLPGGGRMHCADMAQRCGAQYAPGERMHITRSRRIRCVDLMTMTSGAPTRPGCDSWSHGQPAAGQQRCGVEVRAMQAVPRMA